MPEKGKCGLVVYYVVVYSPKCLFFLSVLFSPLGFNFLLLLNFVK